MYRTLNKILKTFLSDSQIFKYGFNLSPMYKRSTGKVIDVSKNLYYVKVKIPINYKNKNYVGAIFGGSMFSATDPIYMIQLMNILDDNYIVWDKAASINYKRPAKENLYGEFVFTAEEIEGIKKDVLDKKEINLIKELNLVNTKGEVFSEISKTIYISEKSFYKEKLKRRKAKSK